MLLVQAQFVIEFPIPGRRYKIFLLVPMRLTTWFEITNILPKKEGLGWVVAREGYGRVQGGWENHGLGMGTQGGGIWGSIRGDSGVWGKGEGGRESSCLSPLSSFELIGVYLPYPEKPLFWVSVSLYG